MAVPECAKRFDNQVLAYAKIARFVEVRGGSDAVCGDECLLIGLRRDFLEIQNLDSGLGPHRGRE